MRKQLGTHVILDAWGAPADRLNDPARVRQALVDAVAAAGATLVSISEHQFTPYGITITAILAESHIALHTWPEHGYLGADLFFCGSLTAEAATTSLVDAFGPERWEVRALPRGVGGGGGESEESTGSV